MLFEKIIGKLGDAGFSGMEVDTVDFDWHEIYKRLHKKTSRNGKELAVSLDSSVLSHGLRDGDLLGVDGNTLFAVNILPCEAIVVTADAHLIPKVCYEIGNKHAALLFGETDSEFVTPYNEPTKQLLEKIGVQVTVKMVKLDFDRAISSTVSSHTH